MNPAQINHSLKIQLAFALSCDLPDAPEAIAKAWPAVFSDHIQYDAFSAVKLSSEASRMAYEAGLYAQAKLTAYLGVNEVRVHVPNENEHIWFETVPALEFKSA
jgi:hypothetical protein